MTFTNRDLVCAVRRRLGIGVACDGPDPHGHTRLAQGIGGRTHARHTKVLTAWRQVFIEARGIVPDKNVERMLSRTHVPVPMTNEDWTSS